MKLFIIKTILMYLFFKNRKAGTAPSGLVWVHLQPLLRVVMVLLVLFMSGCSTIHKITEPKDDGFFSEELFKDFIPISPISLDSLRASGIPVNLDTNVVRDGSIVRPLALHPPDTILKYFPLPNEATYVAIKKTNSEGNVSYSSAEASFSKDIYVVTLDYIKFRTIKIPEKVVGEDTCHIYLRIGVGLRIVADVQTTEKDIDIGSLFNLGIAAQNNKLTGTLSLDVIGLESPEITSLIPLPSEISPSSIQNLVQDISLIKSKIYEEGTNLNPQIVSIKIVSCSKNSKKCSVHSVIDRIISNKNKL